MKDSMFKSTLVLTLVCIIAAALLGAAYVITKEQIDQQAVLALNENLKQVFPDADNFEAKEDYYAAIKDNDVVGYAAIADSQGYASVLKILVGMDLNKKVTGIRIMEHEETPGLGANAIRPDFYSQLFLFL
jgi:electron transport complex protein RnfG